ncbi:polyamine aminopropyltransferase [Kiloniella laminariae]|uniref:polyamine aminopropyltransferase n=1 Tax=Kiloniella laminariae TaxID=454162 RepID=UPI000362A2C0|nr:polyamine aminopropyltransferase [Kiloniella laminariae]
MSRWVTEGLHGDLRTSYGIKKVLFDNQTEHQNLVIYENEIYGRIMALDGVTQVTERDEFIYHEMLAHVPILAHGEVQKVLIIGGGDGGMLEEVLKHRSVAKVTMVEIDRTVIDLSKEHLPMICGNAFEDPRLDLVISDGCLFVENSSEKYDVIIVDSTDPIGPGEVLFTNDFYSNCKACLREGGVLVTQNGVPFHQASELRSTLRHFRPIFAEATCYLASVPTYVGGAMAFGWGTDQQGLKDVSLEVLEARFQNAQIDTSYYTPEVHRAAFALPGYVQRLVA